MSEPDRKPRRRRVPSWEIHSAAGVRVAGGASPTWWDDARPVIDPRPAMRPIYSGDCTERERA